MTRSFLISLAVVPTFAIAAPALKEKPPEQSLVGVWERTGYMQSGMPLAPDKQVLRHRFSADGQWSWSYGGQAFGPPSKYTMDQKQNPPTFDLSYQENPPADYRGIYKIEGDVLDGGRQRTAEDV